MQEHASHKVIEKRRRDRINNCLSELSQTVPAAFSKQSSGKLEKAEILEMTVEYLRAIQATEIGLRFENGDWFSTDIWTDFMHHYKVGYNDCIREIQRFMTDVEGVNADDDRCIRLISYLQTRFRPDSSISGGAAYREALERLVNSQSRRLTSRNQHISRSDHLISPGPVVPSLSRFSPYPLPNTMTSISRNMQPRLTNTDLKEYTHDDSVFKTNIRTFCKQPGHKNQQIFHMIVNFQKRKFFLKNSLF
ncbi:hypothetical protein FSP39_015320 [Pinctada imbricata]|uniref:Hairy and enhancer of split-related protein HELT n=1 Tax=Pinctada imbricata TaxID=66713 RepID=A0AA89BPS9_PINIB|nr:hypothetical protein FSP39_015320 [Pinctada imbricata]